jgi:hypothetical protein
VCSRQTFRPIYGQRLFSRIAEPGPAPFKAVSIEDTVTPSLQAGSSGEPERHRGPSDNELHSQFEQLLWDFEHRRHHQTVEQLRRASRILALGFGRAHERRRAEDKIRDEWHDARAVTIKAGKKL